MPACDSISMACIVLRRSEELEGSRMYFGMKYSVVVTTPQALFGDDY